MSDDLAKDYRVAFLRYLPDHSEAALTSAYEIGRRAVEDGVSVLDLAQVHHAVLVDALVETPSDEVQHVATSACAFFLEVLATFDMAHRSRAQESVDASTDPA